MADKPKNWPECLPWIDPDVEVRDMDYLQQLTAGKLVDQKRLVLLVDINLYAKLGVLMSWEMYEKMQKQLSEARDE